MESVFLCYNPYMSTKIEKNEKGVIKISVRDLVEFILREGDIDNRHGRGASAEAMLAGGRIHRKIQKRKGSNYHAEVPLKIAIEEEKYQLVIEGRADGILIESATEEITFADNFNHRTIPIDCKVTIDEIKGMYMKLDLLEDAIGVHRAQAMCYAYIYALQHDLSAISVQMTYCNLDTEDIRYFHYDYTFEELADWFEKLIDEYKKWADFQFAWKKLRRASIKPLQFPFPYRDGQRELVAGVYRTIKRKKNLFIQAPTGAGKTISTVFPAVKAVGEDLADKIFYLTAKTITGTVAREAFELLRKNGYQAKVLTITAKEKLCLCEEMECNPINCPYAKGHYDRVNDAVFSLLQKEDVITREVILEQAKEYNVCPFEMCLDTATWVDDIICDYNYVFDPNVRLKRYFAEGEERGNYIFLVDEAHNLVSRAREMYSAVLIKEELLAAKRILKGIPEAGKVLKLLERCNRRMLDLKRLGETEPFSDEADMELAFEGGARMVLGEHYRMHSDVKLLSLELMGLFGEMEVFLNENSEFDDRETVLDLYFKIRDFLYVSDRLDENYRIYSRLLADGSFMVKLMCVNPSSCLRECLDRGVSTVFFSATLLPIRYYKELLSGSQEEYAVYAKSPFQADKRLVLAASDVSSRYSRRGRTQYERIADYIEGVIGGKTGNYMIFFPSYQFLFQVQKVLEERQEQGKLKFEWKAQSSNMSEEEREEFLLSFKEEPKESFAGLCVMGGIFSEGIDLKEERLIGAIIIGTGLPQVNPEQEILKEYFDEQGEGGFDYAYQYPGMNKVMQAAGRVIRTVNDKGVIALLDDRFLLPEYVALFPREWERYTVVNRFNVKQAVDDFWGQFV